MNDIKDLREELKRRKAAQPVPEPRSNALKYVVLASFTLAVLAVAAVSML